jgi:hypothetical protein
MGNELSTTRARGQSSTTRHGNGSGQGEGWGGPARGPGKGPANDPRRLIPGRSAEVRRTAAEKRELRETRAEALEDMLFELSFTAMREETRIAAAARLHAIYCGPPGSQMIVSTGDEISRMSDEELAAEIQRLGGATVDRGLSSEPLATGRSCPTDPVEAMEHYRRMIDGT